MPLFGGRKQRLKPGLTAAIPTCGRPDKLRKCMEHLLVDNILDRILIWNSAPCEKVRSLAAEFPVVAVIESECPTGPGEAR